MILIDGLFINNSGGLVLLRYLIKELGETLNIHYLIDERIKGEFSFEKKQATYLSNSLWKRHLFYLKNKHRFSTILCFGNLPPTLKLNAKVYTYFHNVLFYHRPSSYPIKQKLSKLLKGKVLQLFAKNTDEFWVQSDVVKALLHSRIESSVVEVLPFYENRTALNNTNRDELERRNNFCFISNANDHKNHLNLLKAWSIVNKESPKYKLHLTVTELYPNILEQIEIYRKAGVNIENHGWTDPICLFERCQVQVYPSLVESFGLSLIESVENGCELLAADLPYVHEVIEAAGWFDPDDPQSIAESVLNYDPSNLKLTSKIKINNEIDQIIKKLTS